MKWGIHWFEKDLRIIGNESLIYNFKYTQGRTLGIYCISKKLFASNNFPVNQFALKLSILQDLALEFSRRGGELLVIENDAYSSLKIIIKYLIQNEKQFPSLITSSKNYTKRLCEEEEKIAKFLSEMNIEYYKSRDNILFEPDEIMIKVNSKDFYKVYSPYGKKWFQKLKSNFGFDRIQNQKKLNSFFDLKRSNPIRFKIIWSDIFNHKTAPIKNQLNQIKKKIDIRVKIDIPSANYDKGIKALKSFKKKLTDYKNRRDLPSMEGTSRLSHFISCGSLSVTQILADINLNNVSWELSNGETQFVKELAWREFYYSILFHCPRVEKEPFNQRFSNIKWQNNVSLFNKWKSGKTGFPIVDAGLNELIKTGWMHNRVRMIVASFLVKDLLIDWRWGEKFFLKHLFDADIASNNGSWQWVASTGSDHQPYFRIFNPWLQSAKFDPQGKYIKKFLPELVKVPAKELHNPNPNFKVKNYPKPIVDHTVQSIIAVNIFKSAKN